MKAIIIFVVRNDLVKVIQELFLIKVDDSEIKDNVDVHRVIEEPSYLLIIFLGRVRIPVVYYVDETSTVGVINVDIW